MIPVTVVLERNTRNAIIQIKGFLTSKVKLLFPIIFTAFLLRIAIALLGEHGDVVNYYWWAKDLWEKGLLGFYDRNIDNAMRPTYPPVTSYIFWLSVGLHQLILKISWVLNIYIPIFPSNFILWLESEKGWYFFNKLPAIFADLGIIYFLYQIGKRLKNRKAGIVSALSFAFSPPFWYNSALWGQTDSIYGFFILTSLLNLFQKKFIFATFLYALAILTKPTAFFAFPILIIGWLRSGRTLLKNVIIFLLLPIALYLPFHPQNLLPWILSFYQRSLGGELSYIVANAFNFWALIFGFDNKPDTSLFLGIPVYAVGNTIFAVLALSIFLGMQKRYNNQIVILLTTIISFAAFLFLPRMHERYFYPTLLLLVSLVGLNKKYMWIFISLSLIHFINLYHFWWFPRWNFIVGILSNHIVEKFLVVLNIIFFLYLVVIFKQELKKIK